MQTKDVLQALRARSGLSQDEVAEKLHVTRQAVSRWEQGETVPSTDTLKLLSGLYDVSINTLLATPRQDGDHYQLASMQPESVLVNDYYDHFDEGSRLNRSQAARVEFVTTVHYLKKYLRPGMRVLDIGPGAGEYSLYLAAQGYAVSAIELAEVNLDAFRRRIAPGMAIDLRQGNALDLSCYADGSFDMVLLLGPLYHLHDAGDRARALREARRVMKDDGVLFAAFINNDMIPFTEWMYEPDYLVRGAYDKETFKVVDYPFVFFDLQQCRDMLRAAGLTILHAVASDGLSELLAEQVNRLDAAGYAQYLRLHLFFCERAEHLGKSNHFLFAAKKTPAEEKA